jgi:hypothetical protein
MDSNIHDIQLRKLTERAKELHCIYRIMEILKDENAELHMVFKSVIEAIPPGWQHPTVCESRILFEGHEYTSVDFRETAWMQESDLIIDNHVAGKIQVVYTQDVFESKAPFLPEEQHLLSSIAENLSRFIFFRRLRKTFEMTQNYESVTVSSDDSSLLAYESDEHWKWRYHVAEKIAQLLDFERFGIEALYLLGSTKTATAGPGSDIDLMAHFRGTPGQRLELLAWMEGWGLGLAELNFIKTGYTTPGSLIDLHIITDEDIRNRNSYAVMILSTENSAKLLKSRP